MHHPPEVWLLVNGSPWSRRILAVVGFLAVLQVSGFLFWTQLPTWQTATVAASLLVAIGFAGFWTQGSASGNLHWDGVQWQWSGFPNGVCALQLHLDFQGLMLVSLHAPKVQPVWWWLQRSRDPYQWLALRRAVMHSTAPGRVLRANGPAADRAIATP